MARFLVLFDRSVRRIRGKRGTYETQVVQDRARAEALPRLAARGYDSVNIWAEPEEAGSTSWAPGRSRPSGPALHRHAARE
jgi:hypothetical protein